jgi:hypothetical protein
MHESNSLQILFPEILRENSEAEYLDAVQHLADS